MANLAPGTTNREYREEHARGREHDFEGAGRLGKAGPRSDRGGLAVEQPGAGDVQIAFVEGFIAMRNGDRPESPSLIFAPDEWRKFVLNARGGEFDLT